MIDDVAAVERAEKSLDEFINSRSKAKDKANELAAAWARSEAVHREKLRRENRALWYEFHLRLADSHARIADENRAKAEALLAEPGGGGTR